MRPISLWQTCVRMARGDFLTSFVQTASCERTVSLSPPPLPLRPPPPPPSLLLSLILSLSEGRCLLLRELKSLLKASQVASCEAV